jgi:hypothetical protein
MTGGISATTMRRSGIKKDTCRPIHGCQHTDGGTPFLTAFLSGKLSVPWFLSGGQLWFFPK